MTQEISLREGCLPIRFSAIAKTLQKNCAQAVAKQGPVNRLNGAIVPTELFGHIGNLLRDAAIPTDIVMEQAGMFGFIELPEHVPAGRRIRDSIADVIHHTHRFPTEWIIFDQGNAKCAFWNMTAHKVLPLVLGGTSRKILRSIGFQAQLLREGIFVETGHRGQNGKILVLICFCPVDDPLVFLF